MFYAHIVLAKKGPLARIWLAAHWDKKLTKAHVFETNIEQSVDGIMQPKVKLALRTSGHLLLGVVRIYSRKAKYLLADCNEAFVKIKMAFRPGMVDLPEEHREAAVNAITLPEVFHDFDTALPELNEVDIEAQFSINQSRADEITMREDYGTLPMSMHDDGFGDMGFDSDPQDLARDGLDPNMEHNLFGESMHSKDAIPGTSRSVLDSIGHHNPIDDGFGGEFGQPAAGLFEGDLFGEAPMQSENLPAGAMTARTDSDDDMDDHFDGGAPSPCPSDNSRPASRLAGKDGDLNAEGGARNAEELDAAGFPAGPSSSLMAGGEMDQAPQSALPEEETFALAPVEVLRNAPKAKRKRKLIVDEVKNISGEEMKNQLANTSDIVTTLDLAPPTKRLMSWKETGGVEKLFGLPAREIPARCLFQNFQRNLISRTIDLEDFSVLGPADVLALEYQRPESPKQRGRKRKQASMDNQPALQQSAQEASLPEPDLMRDQSEIMSPGMELRQSELHGTEPMMPGTPSIHHLNSPSNNHLMASGLGQLPGDLHLTPAGLCHGGMTPHHTFDNMESIPNLPADQVSAVLNGSLDNYGFDGGHHSPGGGLSDRVANDWHDDYDIPIAQGPAEEQQEDETDEQFEERVLNKRAAAMFKVIRTKLVDEESLLLSEFTQNSSKKMAAQKFYSLLVLKKFQALEIDQQVPFGDIVVTRGVMFDNPKL